MIPISKIFAPLVLAGAIAGVNNPIGSAQSSDPPQAVKNSDSSIKSTNDFFSLNLNKNTNKYELKLAKEEDIRKYFKDRGEEDRIKRELFILDVIKQAINERISPLKHVTLELKEDKAIQPNQKTLKVSQPILKMYKIGLVESVPQKSLPEDFPASSINVDIDSIAIRQFGKEKVISFKETIPEDFEKPDGRRIEHMVICPLDSRLIITKGDNAYFIQAKK